VITGGTLEATTDTAAGDNAAIGYTAAEGLILTGQGSTSDITLKNDADAIVFTVPTGTDDILFPDGAKAIFGAGSDLQIYHDGTNSYIDDSGTGGLNIRGSSYINLQKYTGETMALFNADGAVELRHNNATKFATTASGISVTGAISSNKGSAGTLATFTDGVNSNFVVETSSLLTTIGNGGGSASLAFKANNTEAMRINSSGSVGIGTTTPDSLLELYKAGTSELMIGSDNAGTAQLSFYEGTSSTKEGFLKYDGASNNVVLGTSGAANALVVTRDVGYVMIGTTTQRGQLTVERASNDVFGVNRTGNDGTIVGIYQAGTQEGNISVSGTTVSYNGGHLSRWSQLTSNTRDDAIVKGTVMTNLDQMAEWTDEGVTEENEQLNCMAVSSVEGDANVAGVFVNWDNDDGIYTNDMNVAMTGDMIIRIAQGTTVAKGDLLMSAGDGTAKPQGDDIVRSKTIAKVTSTNVSHTYDDGSYCVPCVLMAC
jgi:hypothetical protein